MVLRSNKKRPIIIRVRIHFILIQKGPEMGNSNSMSILGTAIVVIFTSFIVVGCKSSHTSSQVRDVGEADHVQVPSKRFVKGADVFTVAASEATLAYGDTVVSLKLSKNSKDPVTGAPSKCICQMYVGKNLDDTYVVYVEDDAANVIEYANSITSEAHNLGSFNLEETKVDEQPKAADIYTSGKKTLSVTGKDAMLNSSIALKLSDSPIDPVTGTKPKCICQIYFGKVGADTYVARVEDLSATVTRYANSQATNAISVGIFDKKD